VIFLTSRFFTVSRGKIEKIEILAERYPNGRLDVTYCHKQAKLEVAPASCRLSREPVLSLPKGRLALGPAKRKPGLPGVGGMPVRHPLGRRPYHRDAWLTKCSLQTAMSARSKYYFC
jgi:hypothetical protein